MAVKATVGRKILPYVSVFLQYDQYKTYYCCPPVRKLCRWIQYHRWKMFLSAHPIEWTHCLLPATLEGSYITNGGESNSGEKNITVRDLSSTKQLYNIKGNQTVTVDYKLELNEDRKNNEMKLTIDYNGAEKPQEILLNMPLPLQENKGGKEPKVIIQRYNVDPSKVLAGNYVTLNLFVENTNNLAVNNVSIQLDVPTETSSSGGTAQGYPLPCAP